MVRASFIAIFKRLDLELLKDLERLKHSRHYFLRQQTRYDVAI